MVQKFIYNGVTYPNARVIEGSNYMSMPLLSTALEIPTITIAVDSEDDTLPQFQRNTPLYHYSGDVPIAVYYVQDVQRLGLRTYQIYATWRVGTLSGADHMGGIYTGQTAEEVITDICGSVPVIVKSSIKNARLYGWLPIDRRRANLGQVLFALGAYLKEDLNGNLRVNNLWDGLSGVTDATEMYIESAVAYSAKVTQVSVTEHQFAAGGDTTTLFEGTAQQGDVITFSNPVYELSATGFQILSSGANYAVLSSGTGTLTGREYIHNIRRVTRAVSSAAEPNEKSVEDATLVSIVNSAEIADRMVNFYKWTEVIDAPVVYNRERAGDVINIYHPFSKAPVNACLQSADVVFSASTQKAQEKLLVGFVPPAPSGETQAVRQIFTTSGSFTVPEGVRYITVVLIGAGQGGCSGQKGADAEAGTAFTKESSASVSTRGFSLGKGGEGGVGGSGGSGGKIFQMELQVTEGQVFTFSIGTGGQGGSYSEGMSNAGADGGNTTFGSLSSANGSASASGYTDIITGQVYALPGDTGINGGSGTGWDENTDTDTLLQGVLKGSSVAAPDGSIWIPGEDDSSEMVVADDYESDSGVKTELVVTSKHILSGGAAVGSHGTVSGGALSTVTAAGRWITGERLEATSEGGRGGTGANAVAPTKSSAIGGGGMGGHGGGGGGGGPANWGVWTIPDGAGVSISNLLTASLPGIGGQGSNGGQGGDGAVILYYNAPVVTKGGGLLGRKSKIFLDRNGRLVVV